MTEKTPTRSEIPVEFTWNATSVYESPEVIETEFERFPAAIQAAAAYRGRLGESPQVLLEALDALQDAYTKVGKMYMYAQMAYAVDTTNQEAAKLYGRSQGFFGQAAAAMAYINPELLEIGQERLQEWTEAEPALRQYEHYFHNLFRGQEHVRSAEVEEVLGMLADPFTGPETTHTFLVDADFKHRPAHSAAGEELALNESALHKILAGDDRDARRSAWESYFDTFLSFKNTLTSNLNTSIKQNVFASRVRRYSSTLEAALSEQNIPTAVFTNLIDTFRANLPTWHRYWAIRRKALGVENLHPYDIWAPLTSYQPEVPFEQAVDWISEGLQPMGQEYVEVLRQGCLRDRWVDIYPNQGKTSGAFSTGWKGTHPFILTSYEDSLFSMSTLAHELGHSMHTYLTFQNQPFLYTRYGMFVAETASNFHQAMVRAYLLENNPDPNFQIKVIEEAMSNFHRYFFIMPTLARFELETHQRVEQGQGLAADDLIELMADLFSEGYGDQVVVDRPRVGMTWATFRHLYVDYYVFQYATGISAANALAKRIRSGEAGAVEDYLRFLKAGGSLYPLDALKTAGVDLTTPQPVEAAFQVLAGLVDRLESLVG